MGEGEGGMIWENSIETYILSRLKQITSPGWMHETSAQGWCTGKTQRDGMGREVGGGFRWGTHVNPWLIYVNVWQNPLQYCKVFTLQLIKINEKRKKERKDPDAGKDWGQEEKGTTEDEMVGWHHRLDAHGFGWIPGVGDGQGGLACCSPWGLKESDTTERLNWTDVNTVVMLAAHSSILAWRIPWTEDTAGL